MDTQSNQLDFSGQVFCVGMDVHNKNWRVCVRSNQKELKRFSMNPSPEELSLLRSVPGVGAVCSLAFYTELMNMERFPKFDQLKAYFGLIPSVAGSGETVHVKGLSNRRNRYLRHLIIEAAWVSIRKDPALLLSYNKLIQRMKPQDAIVRIAKKLLNRIRYVWKNQKEYVPALVK